MDSPKIPVQQNPPQQATRMGQEYVGLDSHEDAHTHNSHNQLRNLVWTSPCKCPIDQGQNAGINFLAGNLPSKRPRAKENQRNAMRPHPNTQPRL